MAKAIQELYKSQRGLTSTVKEAQAATAGFLTKWADEGKIGPEDYSVRDAFEVFVVEGLRARGIPFDVRTSDFSEVREELVSSTFPTITAKLIHPRMISTYDYYVEDLLPLFEQTESNRREEDVAGTTDMDRPQHVEEAAPYPDAGMVEKYVHIRNHKFGQTFGLTREMVQFDQTGELLSRAQRSGQTLADVLEEFACYRLTDTAYNSVGDGGTSQAYVPNGTRRAIYADTSASWDIGGQANDNLIGSGSGGAPSYSQTESMMNLLKGMKSEKGVPVRIRPTTVFGSAQLGDKLARFFANQEYDVNSAERNVNIYRNKFRIYTSPFFPNTSEWFLGAPEKQFRMQWVWRPQTTVDRAGDPRRDILMNFYCSMFVGIGATDHRYVAKNYGS